jgi:hypothetical protein
MIQQWISLLLVALLLSGGTIWLLQYQEYLALEILAAQDGTANTVPVYDRFEAQQTFKLFENIYLSRIAIPIWSFRSDNVVYVSLAGSGTGPIAEWQIHTSLVESREVLKFSKPDVKLGPGKYTLSIRVPEISVFDREQAPRVFIESADEYYPHGNYSIANRPKKGDISFSIWANKSMMTKWWNNTQTKPLLIVTSIGWICLSSMLVGAIPRLIHKQLRLDSER